MAFDPAGFWPPGFVPPGYFPAAGPVFTPPDPPRDLDCDLVALLKAATGLDADNTVSPPDNRNPIKLVFTLVSEVSTLRLKGAAGLARRTYQLDFRGAPSQVATIAAKVEALRLAVQSVRGAMGTNAIRQATFRRLPTRFEEPTRPAPALCRVSAEVGFWYRQPIP